MVEIEKLDLFSYDEDTLETFDLIKLKITELLILLKKVSDQRAKKLKRYLSYLGLEISHDINT